MGTTTLLSGECLVWKNGTSAGSSISTLSYDQDLGFFKVVTGGNIWLSFRTNQVMGSQVITTGTISKRYHVSVSVKFPTGDEYVMRFLAPSQGASVTVKAWIDNLTRIGRFNAEVQALAKIKEKVAMSEIASILAKHGMPNSVPDSIKMTENLIASGIIDGVIEGETFVTRQAKQRETVSYQVVTSFDIAKDGVISLKCPSCGSPVRMVEPSKTKRCDYCGADFVVPKRILDML